MIIDIFEMKQAVLSTYTMAVLLLITTLFLFTCSKSNLKLAEDNTYNNLQTLKIDYKNFEVIRQMFELDDGTILIHNFGHLPFEHQKIIRLNRLGNPIDSLTFNDPGLRLSNMTVTDNGQAIIGGTRIEGENPCRFFSQPCHYFTPNIDFFYQVRAVLLKIQVEPRLRLSKEVFVLEQDVRYNAVDNVISGSNGRIYFLGDHTNDWNVEHKITWRGGNIYFGSIDQDLAATPILSTPRDITWQPTYTSYSYEGSVDGKLYYPDGSREIWTVDISRINQLNILPAIELPSSPFEHYRNMGPIITKDNDILIFRYTKEKNTLGQYESLLEKYAIDGQRISTQKIFVSDSTNYTITAFAENESGVRIISGSKISDDRSTFELYTQQIGIDGSRVGDPQFYGTPLKIEYPNYIIPSASGGFWVGGWVSDEDSNAVVDITGQFLLKARL